MNSILDIDVKKKDYAKFALLSLLGFFVFLCPVPDVYSDATTLVIGILTTAFHNGLGVTADYITVGFCITSFIGTILVTFFLKDKVPVNSRVYKLFYAQGFNLVTRLIGCILLVMVFWGVGPAILLNENVGSNMFSLCVIIGVELVPALVLMPLLIDFGLMECFGTLINKFVRPVFNLPGRASVDLLASWVGMIEMGLMVTEEQYVQGYYTRREAVSIATCFTATGVAFWLVCGEVTGAAAHLIQFLGAIFLVGIIAAAVCIRIPPLSRIPDVYTVENENNIDPTSIMPKDCSLLQYSLALGAKKAKSAPSLKKTLGTIIYQNLSIFITLVPLAMAVGVAALALVEYTPLIDWMGYPFALLLNLLGVPEATLGGGAIAAGFFDLFFPALLVSGAQSIQLKFIVTVVGLTQIVFCTEVLSYLLNSRIPVKFIDMFVLFVERSVIAILVLVPYTYICGITG